jgi:Uma2 family endonuclease
MEEKVMSTLVLPETMGLAAPMSITPNRNGIAVDDSLYEIVDGIRVELPAMSFLAIWVASCLNGFLWPFVEKNKLGRAITEAIFILDAKKDIRRRPDVAFVSAQTWPLDRPIPSVGDLPVAPDLAVEVNSPTDAMDNVIDKIIEYFHHGVREVWLILPRQGQVYVYTSPTQVRILTAKEELADTIVPGFRLNLAELFRDADKS